MIRQLKCTSNFQLQLLTFKYENSIHHHLHHIAMATNDYPTAIVSQTQTQNQYPLVLHALNTNIRNHGRLVKFFYPDRIDYYSFDGHLTYVSSEPTYVSYPLLLTAPIPSGPQEISISIEGKARGNIYVSPRMLKRMVNEFSDFVIDSSDHQKNIAFAYNYFNESVGMQCNDKRIKAFSIPSSSQYGVYVPQYILLVNIDLIDRENNPVYVVAIEETDVQFQANWNVWDFKTATQITNLYNIAPAMLPISSRVYLEKLQSVCAEYIPFQVVNETDYDELPIKATGKWNSDVPTDTLTNKQVRRAKKQQIRYMREVIDEKTFRMSCVRSWNEPAPFIPVIVVKGNKQWIEYKKYIKIHGKRYYQNKYFALSIRWANKWEICCIDTNNELIYYQHRLIGSQSKYLAKYKELLRYCMVGDE
eukprot:937949_1